MGFINNALGDLWGAGMGLIFGEFNNERQLRQQEQLQRLQIEGQKEMTDYNMMKQLQMWKDTNYHAQVEEMKKAGINPALLYGKGGAGGATTGTANGSVTGGNAPVGGREFQDFIGMQMQRQLMDAQKELISAQAENVKADTQMKTGVQTEESKARIDLLLANVSNENQRNNLMRLEERLQHIEAFEKQASQSDRLNFITYQTKMALKQLQIVENEAFISDETVNQKVQIIHQEALAAVLRNALTQAQTAKTTFDITTAKAQIEKWAKEISIASEQLNLNEQKIAIEKFVAEFNANHPGMWNSLGRIVEEGVEQLNKTITGQYRNYMYKIPKK